MPTMVFKQHEVVFDEVKIIRNTPGFDVLPIISSGLGYILSVSLIDMFHICPDTCLFVLIGQPICFSWEPAQ